MRKNFLVVIAMVAMMAIVVLFSAGVVLAGDARVDGDGNASALDISNTNNNTLTNNNSQNQHQLQDQNQRQQQEQIANGGNAAGGAGGNSQINFSGNNLGRLPEAQTHGIGTAVVPMSEYGHLVTQMGFGPSVGCTEPMTMSNFDTMVSVLEETPGAQKWDDINKKIIPDPIMRQRFPALEDKDPVFFFPPEEAVAVLSQLKDQHLAGLMVYNSELDKKRPVLVPYFKARANLDARRIGANVVIPVDQFFQGYFVPEGTEFSVGGLLSFISKTFTGGGSIAGNAGVSHQQNTEFGRPGAAFIFLGVKNPRDLCGSAKVVEKLKVETPQACNPDEFLKKVAELEVQIKGDPARGIKGCTRWCLHNLNLRLQLADTFVDLFVCTGDKKYLDSAVFHYGKAEENYKKGWDISANRAEADKAIARVYYAWAGAIYEINGQAAAVAFAQTKNLERFPNGFAR
jgi:hypothetical protein